MLAALTLLGCDTGSPDRDGDGSPNFDDCAPDDPNSFPGAEEVCDGLDNDCDTRIDNGLLVDWFVDADGDGFGREGSEVAACTAPLGTVDKAGDCDDTEALVFPGAPERCDGADNDCDEIVDEGTTSLDFTRERDNDPFTLTGDAVFAEDTDDAFLRLTPASPDRTGAVWVARPVPATQFRVRFRARMTTAGSDIGEGLALAIVTEDETPLTTGRPWPRLRSLRRERGRLCRRVRRLPQ